MKKLAKKLFTAVLSLMMLFTLLPGTLIFAQDSTLSDPSTLTGWEDAFGTENTLSTNDIGRIWVDKSVSTNNVTLSGDIGQNVTINKAADAEFLVGLSALGSAADIHGAVSVPTDTVFVLDMSPKMRGNNAEDMFTAANQAIQTLMKANENNRIAVIAYSNRAEVLLPLNHYTNTDADYLLYDNYTAEANGKLLDGGSVTGNSFEIHGSLSGVSKNTQAGMYLGMQQLAAVKDTSVEVNGQQLTRKPQAVLLSEGEPKLGNTNFTAPATDGTVDIDKLGGINYTRHAQTFALLLTASYMKQEVTKHYYGDVPEADESASIYTIGVNIADADSVALAEIALNPKGELYAPDPSDDAQDFLGYFNEFNTNGQVSVSAGTGAFNDRTFQKPANVAIDSLAYNDEYYSYSRTDSSTGVDWNKIFQEITENIIENAPMAPTQVEEGAAGTGGESGKLIFTDHLSSYMKVSGSPVVVFAGTTYTATVQSSSQDETTYAFSGSVDGNGVYPNGNLADLSLSVKTNSDGTQTLTWEIPASLLPLRTMKVEGTSNGAEMSYTIVKDKEAYPIRLFYSVKQENPSAFTEKDNDYLNTHSKNGKTVYYEGAWSDDGDEKYGTTSAVFTPADSNAFYHYTEDTLLYVLHSNQGYLSEAQAKAANKTVVAPGNHTLVVDGVTYSLQPATEYVSQRAYFYAHTYYQTTGIGNTAEELIDYHMLEDGSRINTDVVDGNVALTPQGNLYVKAGTNKLSRVSDVAVNKTQNETSTATTVRHPIYDMTQGAQVTVYLGNNGKTEKDTPSGTLSVSVGNTTAAAGQTLPPDADDQEFEYKLELFNYSDSTNLTGTYTITIKDGSGVLSTAQISTNGTFKLKKGQTAEIAGLPAASAYRLTETLTAGYEPTYSGDPQSINGNTGLIQYRSASASDVPYAEVTVTHTYDNTKVVYNLNYNGNPLENGTLQQNSLPESQSGHGGEEITLSDKIPVLTFGGQNKKAVFIGWSQTKSAKIYGVEDQSEYETWKSNNPVYAAKSSFTINAMTELYAVWGWDTNGDGTPDVEETSYQLTYDANGGYFDQDTGKLTKVITTVKQDAYVLMKKGDSALPTHADAEWNGNSVKVAFLGWSATQDTKIYSVNDTYPTTIIANTKIDANKTVYALWGYDSAGDGIADLDRETHQITVNSGENGSASAQYGGKTSKTAAAKTIYNVIDGDDLTIQIQPDSGYAVKTITVDGTTFSNSKNAASPNGTGYTSTDFGSLTFQKVTSNHTVSITFAPSSDDQYPDELNRTLTYDANGGSGGPGIVEGLSDNKTYQLDQKNVPAHAKAEGKSVVFLGWTQSAETKILTGDDTKPTLLKTVMPKGANITVYALWGYDSNGDGVADIDEANVTLSYDTNGGNDDGPMDAQIKRNVPYALNTQKVPTHARDAASGDAIVFIGWTAAKDIMVYDADSVSQPSIITEITPDADTIVYAVWGFDRNEDGIADVKQDTYRLFYDGNAQNGGKVDGVLQDQGKYVEKQQVRLSAQTPTHSDIEQRKVVFVGWSKTKTTQIYEEEDKAVFAQVQLVSDVTFTSQDCTVYAVWGYDDDDDGKADVIAGEYAIIADSGENGSITPSGTVYVKEGDTQSFTIQPKQQYALNTITIDGTTYHNNGELQLPNLTFTKESKTYSYEFVDVTQAHSITVTFALDANGNNIPDQYEEPEEMFYTLSVENGRGSGTYAAGEKVELVASVIEGKTFVRWVSDNGGTFADDTAERSVFTMPAADVTVRAVYADVEDEEDQMDQTLTPTPKPGEDEGLPNGNDPSETKPQTTPSKEESAADDIQTAAGNEHLQSWWLGTLGAGAMAVLLLVCKRSKKTDH